MKILTYLKKQGYRLTKPRREIIRVLESRPTTTHEIYDILQKKNISIDLVSIYRTLELLVSLHIIDEITLKDGKKRYELVEKDTHHHHAVCDNCGNIEDIHIEQEDKILHHIKATSPFRIEKHSLEFFGLCAKCQ